MIRKYAGKMKYGEPVNVIVDDKGDVMPAFNASGGTFAAHTFLISSDRFEDFYVQIDKKVSALYDDSPEFLRSECFAHLVDFGVDPGSLQQVSE